MLHSQTLYLNTYLNGHERSRGAGRINRRCPWKRPKPRFLARIGFSGPTAVFVHRPSCRLPSTISPARGPIRILNFQWTLNTELRSLFREAITSARFCRVAIPAVRCVGRKPSASILADSAAGQGAEGRQKVPAKVPARPSFYCNSFPDNELRMEAGGIEPPSRDGSGNASTCVVDRLNLGAADAGRQASAFPSPTVVSRESGQASNTH